MQHTVSSSDDFEKGVRIRRSPFQLNGQRRKEDDLDGSPRCVLGT